jgi:hypothetical protein
MPLTDKLRAAVFARDKAICAFSGLSVWMLDYGATPFSHSDWPDHVVPRSRGGRDTIDNLVCASYFYNGKKSNNGRDRDYLFRDGRPSPTFLYRHGELSESQAKLLADHASITEADWYFNRALFNMNVALVDEAVGAKAKRGRHYWLRSAYRRLLSWRSLSGSSSTDSFVRRRLVRFSTSPDVQLMLSIGSADEDDLRRIYQRLLAHYRANDDVLDLFVAADGHRARVEVIKTSSRRPFVTTSLLSILRRNTARLMHISAG